MEQTSQTSWKCDAKGSGAIIYDIASQLYPICRSITGDGVRASLDILARHVPLTVHEVPTGTQVFDWTIPREWNIRDAYVKDADRPQGDRLPSVEPAGRELQRSGASHAFAGQAEEAHSLAPRSTATSSPTAPPTIQERGVSASRTTSSQQLADGDYEVVIDATLADGHLTYAEYSARRRDGRKKSCCRHTSATRRLQTTIARAWRCWPMLAQHLR